MATIAPAATTEDAVAAVDAAAEAFKTWSTTGPGERRALLMKASHALEAKAEAFAAVVAAETGASAIWAGFNVHLAAGMLLEAASLTTQISGEVIPSDVPGNLAMAVRQPAGVVLGIAPWNAPVILAVRAIATPLACGNTVVLKGSEICPATHGLIVEALQEAGFPKGVVNFVTNAPADAAAVVEAMVAHPAVRRVNFTGSTHVGKLIAATCAKYLKPVVLELGGKAPWSSWTMPTSTPPSTQRCSVHSPIPGRSACRPSASWSTKASPMNSSPSSVQGPRVFRWATHGWDPWCLVLSWTWARSTAATR